nr:F-box domain [Pandoravirus massiliensis]
MLLSMPDEIIVAILVRARPLTSCLVAAGAVCRWLASICQEDSLWRAVAVSVMSERAVRTLCLSSHKAFLRLAHRTQVTIHLWSRLEYPRGYAMSDWVQELMHTRTYRVPILRVATTHMLHANVC